jgi:hypothetical protein
VTCINQQSLVETSASDFVLLVMCLQVVKTALRNVGHFLFSSHQLELFSLPVTEQIKTDQEENKQKPKLSQMKKE